MSRAQQRRAGRRHSSESQVPEQSGEAVSEIDQAEVEAVLDEIDCCLADVAGEDQGLTDEQRAEKEFGKLWDQYHHRKLNLQDMKDQGDLLRAQYAHTAYVQRWRCCTCGSCPWNDEEGG